MIYRRGKLYALLPANVSGDTLFSHQGLTYGGLIMSDQTTAADVVEIFRQLNSTLREEGLRQVIYKPVPWIYHQQPAEEDLYAIVEVGDVRSATSVSPAACRPPSPGNIPTRGTASDRVGHRKPSKQG